HQALKLEVLAWHGVDADIRRLDGADVRPPSGSSPPRANARPTWWCSGLTAARARANCSLADARNIFSNRRVRPSSSCIELPEARAELDGGRPQIGHGNVAGSGIFHFTNKSNGGSLRALPAA